MAHDNGRESSNDTPSWTAINDHELNQPEEVASPGSVGSQQQSLHTELSETGSDGDTSPQISDGIIMRSGQHRIEDGGTGTYMIDGLEGSYTGALRSESDPEVQRAVAPQTMLVLNRLRRKQESADHEEGDTHSEASSQAEEPADHEEGDHHFDASLQAIKEYSPTRTLGELTRSEGAAILRTKRRGITQKLRYGGILSVRRRGVIANPLYCAHPFCDIFNKHIPAEAYYAVLSQPGQPQHSVEYCLSCLDKLLNRKD